MNAMDAAHAAMVVRYLGRPWRAADGIETETIAAAERALGVVLPEALRSLYRCIGAVAELVDAHNHVRAPGELTFEEGYLLFMDENEDVVTFGIRRDDLSREDPPTWQRVNAPTTEWYPEEKTLTELMTSMFEWYTTIGVLPFAGSRR